MRSLWQLLSLMIMTPTFQVSTQGSVVEGLNWSTWVLIPALTQWLRECWSFTPFTLTSVAPSEKNEEIGLNNLQLPFQLAHSMLSFGRKGLIFRNNPEFWRTQELFDFISEENSFTILSFIDVIQKQLRHWASSGNQRFGFNPLCGALQPKPSEMFTFFSDIKGWLQRGSVRLQRGSGAGT